MALAWIVAGVALLTATLSWIRARKTARRLDQLSQMYWELKYEHGELRVRLERLAAGKPEAGVNPAPPPSPEARGDVFVPLASLKR